MAWIHIISNPYIPSISYEYRADDSECWIPINYENSKNSPLISIHYTESNFADVCNDILGELQNAYNSGNGYINLVFQGPEKEYELLKNACSEYNSIILETPEIKYSTAESMIELLVDCLNFISNESGDSKVADKAEHHIKMLQQQSGYDSLGDSVSFVREYKSSVEKNEVNNTQRIQSLRESIYVQKSCAYNIFRTKLLNSVYQSVDLICNLSSCDAERIILDLISNRNADALQSLYYQTRLSVSNDNNQGCISGDYSIGVTRAVRKSKKIEEEKKLREILNNRLREQAMIIDEYAVSELKTAVSNGFHSRLKLISASAIKCLSIYGNPLKIERCSLVADSMARVCYRVNDNDVLYQEPSFEELLHIKSTKMLSSFNDIMIRHYKTYAKALSLAESDALKKALSPMIESIVDVEYEDDVEVGSTIKEIRSINSVVEHDRRLLDKLKETIDRVDQMISDN